MVKSKSKRDIINNKTKKNIPEYDDDDDEDEKKELKIQNLKLPDFIEDLDTLINLDMGMAFQRVYYLHPTQADKKNARKFWNLRDSNQKQCINVIGELQPKTICYMCGFEINEYDSGGNLTADCEHILPVYQACLLLQLEHGKIEKRMEEKDKFMVGKPNNQIEYNPIFNNDKIKTRFLNNREKELKLEYAWSHACCNQIKNDISFLKFDNKNKKFVFNKNNVEYILKKIFKIIDAEHDILCKDVRKIFNKKYKNKTQKDNYLSSRINEIEDIINPICDKLNTNYGKNGEYIFYLTILASLISTADADIILNAQKNIVNFNDIYLNRKKEWNKKEKIIDITTPTSPSFLNRNIHRKYLPIPIHETMIKIEIIYNLSNKLTNMCINYNIDSHFFLNRIIQLLFVTEYDDTIILIDKNNELNFEKIQIFIEKGIALNKIDNTSNNNYYNLKTIFRDVYSILKYSNILEKEDSILNNAEYCFCIACIGYIWNKEIFINENPSIFESNSIIKPENKKIILNQIIEQVIRPFKKSLLELLNSYLGKLKIENKEKNDLILNIFVNLLKKSNLDITSLVKYNKIDNVFIQEIFKENDKNDYFFENSILNLRMQYYYEHNLNTKLKTKPQIMEQISEMEISAVDTLNNLKHNLSSSSTEEMKDAIEGVNNIINIKEEELKKMEIMQIENEILVNSDNNKKISSKDTIAIIEKRITKKPQDISLKTQKMINELKNIVEDSKKLLQTKLVIENPKIDLPDKIETAKTLLGLKKRAREEEITQLLGSLSRTKTPYTSPILNTLKKQRVQGGGKISKRKTHKKI